MTSQQKAQNYFNSNSSVEELFSTSDFTLFLRESDAKNHAKTLTDTTVIKHQNSAVEVKEVIVAKSLLDKTLVEIFKESKSLSKDEIRSYLLLEKEGKKRASLIKYFERQIENLDNENLQKDGFTENNV